MNEYKDGTFGPILPADPLLKSLLFDLPADLRAVHFGTEQELDEIRKRKQADIEAMKDRLDNLERRMNGEIVVFGEDDMKRLERGETISDKLRKAIAAKEG